MKCLIKLVLLTSYLTLPACVSNHVSQLGESYTQPSLEEIQLGEQTSLILQAARPVVQDKVLTAYLLSIKNNLLSTLNSTEIPGDIVVVDDSFAFAYSLSNGDIFLSSGILTLAESREELAPIIAHELGHILLGHFREDREFKQRFSPESNELHNELLAVMHFGRSREGEVAADKVMLSLQQAASYNLCGADQIFKKLHQHWQHTDPHSNTQLFDTHPAMPERIQMIEERTGKDCKQPLSGADSEYQQQVIERLARFRNRVH